MYKHSRMYESYQCDEVGDCEALHEVHLPLKGELASSLHLLSQSQSHNTFQLKSAQIILNHEHCATTLSHCPCDCRDITVIGSNARSHDIACMFQAIFENVVVLTLTFFPAASTSLTSLPESLSACRFVLRFFNVIRSISLYSEMQ